MNEVLRVRKSPIVTRDIEFQEIHTLLEALEERCSASDKREETIQQIMLS